MKIISIPLGLTGDKGLWLDIHYLQKGPSGHFFGNGNTPYDLKLKVYVAKCAPTIAFAFKYIADETSGTLFRLWAV
ncbi:hypothetical protein [Maridesulfovibrio sp.]|uniref:hypothetical protein n=1 Tax=Maridesulfovibrio sp. TaxID=2795000 RepID=UPI003B0026F9